MGSFFGGTGGGESPLNDLARSYASSAGSDSARREARAVEDRLERLSLVCMAMWSLIQDKTDLTEQDLIDRVKLLDSMDGRQDNKASRTVAKCHACGRTVSPQHNKCLYCGEEKKVASVFDLI